VYTSYVCYRQGLRGFDRPMLQYTASCVYLPQQAHLLGQPWDCGWRAASSEQFKFVKALMSDIRALGEEEKCMMERDGLCY